MAKCCSTNFRKNYLEHINMFYILRKNIRKISVWKTNNNHICIPRIELLEIFNSFKSIYDCNKTSSTVGLKNSNNTKAKLSIKNGYGIFLVPLFYFFIFEKKYLSVCQISLFESRNGWIEKVLFSEIINEESVIL